MISIDDDNFPTMDDFVGLHRRTGQEWREPLLKEHRLFHNICEHRTFETARLVFPRGFPSLCAVMSTSRNRSRAPARRSFIGVI